MLEEEVKAEETQGQEISEETPEVTEVEGNTTEEAEWTPDFSYTVYDEKKEFPEDVRELITSKEREDFFRDLYSKADSVDGVKGKYEKARQFNTEQGTELNQVKGELGKLRENYETLAYYVENDLDAYFESSGINDKRLFDYVAEKIDRMERPELDETVKSKQETVRQNYSMQKELEQLKYNQAEQKRQSELVEFNQAISDSNVKSFQEKFDSMMGEGAFVDHVANRGREVYYGEQKNIRPQEAIKYVMDKYGKVISAIPQGAVAQPSQQSQVKGLPNLGKGKGVVPVKRQIRSLDDLRKRAAELAEQNF